MASQLWDTRRLLPLLICAMTFQLVLNLWLLNSSLASDLLVKLVLTAVMRLQHGLFAARKSSFCPWKCSQRLQWNPSLAFPPPPKRRQRGFGGDPTGPFALTLAGPRQTDPPRRGAHPVRGPRGGPGRGRQRHGRLGSDLWRDLDHQGGHSGLQAARPGLR